MKSVQGEQQRYMNDMRVLCLFANMKRYIFRTYKIDLKSDINHKNKKTSVHQKISVKGENVQEEISA